jgi:hypothetical protein
LTSTIEKFNRPIGSVVGGLASTIEIANRRIGSLRCEFGFIQDSKFHQIENSLFNPLFKSRSWQSHEISINAVMSVLSLTGQNKTKADQPSFKPCPRQYDTAHMNPRVISGDIDGSVPFSHSPDCVFRQDLAAS